MESLLNFWRSMRQSIVTLATTQLSDGSAWAKCWQVLGPEGRNLRMNCGSYKFLLIQLYLMNGLNCKLQGKDLFVHQIENLVKVFMRKLQFLSSQLESNTLSHMQTRKEVTPLSDNLNRYQSMLGALNVEGFFINFCLKLELIDLQSDAVLAEQFKSDSLLNYFSKLVSRRITNN